MSVVGKSACCPRSWAQTADAAAADLRTARQRARLTAEHTKRRRVKKHGLCVLCVSLRLSRRMILELTPEQRAFKQSIEQFAREVVAPRRRRIDESGEFPLDVMRAAGGRGLLGVTIPAGLGRRRPRLRQLRARDRSDRAGERDGGRVAVGHQLARRRAASRTPGATPQKEQWLRRLATGEAIGAFALSEPDAGTDAANQQTTAVRSRRAATGSRGRKVWVANAEAAAVAIVFACTRPGPARPGRDGVSGADGHAGHHAHGARRLARRPRARLHGPRSRHQRRRRSGARPGRSGIPARDVGAAGRPRRDCRAGARHRRGGARRGASRTRSSAQAFGQPIANYQAIQWMLADWRPSSRRRAC